MEEEVQYEEESDPTRIFLLEFFISTINLTPTITCGFRKFEKEDCEIIVTASGINSFRIRSDVLKIEKYPMDDPNKIDCSKVGLDIEQGGEEEIDFDNFEMEDEGEEDFEPFTIELNAGRSILFACDPFYLISSTLTNPLVIEIVVKGDVIAHVEIQWSEYLNEMLNQSSVSKKPIDPVVVLNAFKIEDQDNFELGEMNAVLRLSCFGKKIITNLIGFKPQLNENERKTVANIEGITTKLENQRFEEPLQFTPKVIDPKAKPKKAAPSKKIVRCQDPARIYLLTNIQPYYNLAWRISTFLDSNTFQANPIYETYPERNLFLIREPTNEHKDVGIIYQSDMKRFTFHFVSIPEPDYARVKAIIADPTISELEQSVCKHRQCQLVRKLRDLNIGMAVKPRLTILTTPTDLCTLPTQFEIYRSKYPVTHHFGMTDYKRPKKIEGPFLPKYDEQKVKDFLRSCWSKGKNNQIENCPLRLAGGGLNDYENHKCVIGELSPFVDQISHVLCRYRNVINEANCCFGCSAADPENLRECGQPIIESDDQDELDFTPACGIPWCEYIEEKKKESCQNRNPNLKQPVGRTCGHPHCTYVPIECRPTYDFVPTPPCGDPGWCGNPFCANAPQDIKCYSPPKTPLDQCTLNYSLEAKDSFATIDTTSSGPICENPECLYNPPEAAIFNSDDVDAPYREELIREICKNLECPYAAVKCANRKCPARLKGGQDEMIRLSTPLRLRGGSSGYDDSLQACHSLMRQFDDVVSRFKKALGPCGTITCPYATEVMMDQCQATCCPKNPNAINCFQKKAEECSLLPEAIRKSACGHKKCMYARQKQDMIDADLQMELSVMPPATIPSCGHPKCKWGLPELPPIHWECPNPLPSGLCKNMDCPYKKKIDLIGGISSCGNKNCPYRMPDPCSSPFCPFQNKECPYTTFPDEEEPLPADDCCDQQDCPFILPCQPCPNERQRGGADCHDPACSGAKMKSQPICTNPVCPRAEDRKPVGKNCPQPDCPYKQKPSCFDCDDKKDEPCYKPPKEPDSCGKPSCPTTPKPPTPSLPKCTNPNCPFENTLVLQLVPCNMRQFLLCSNPHCPYINDPRPPEPCPAEPSPCEEPDPDSEPKDICCPPPPSPPKKNMDECGDKKPECPCESLESGRCPCEIFDSKPCPCSPRGRIGGPYPKRRTTPLPEKEGAMGPIHYVVGDIDVTMDTRITEDTAVCWPGTCNSMGGELICQECEPPPPPIPCGPSDGVPKKRSNICKVFEEIVEKKPNKDGIIETSAHRLEDETSPCFIETCAAAMGDVVCDDCVIPPPCPPPSKPPKKEKKQKRKKKKKEKRVPYVWDPNDDTRYPGTNIGHKTCRANHFKVPKCQGWLWDIDNVGLPYRRGWRPGAVVKTIAKILEDHREFYFPKEKCEWCQIDQKPTLKVEKENGAYWVTVHPLKDPSTVKKFDSPYMDCTPLKFKIAKPKPEPTCGCEGQDKLAESSSDEGLRFEYTSPAGVIHPELFKEKPKTKQKESQYDPDDFKPPKQEKKKK